MHTLAQQNELALTVLSMSSAPFAVVKTDYPHFYKPPTRFVKVKIENPNHYRSPTRFAAVKSDYPNLYKPPKTV